VSSEIVIDVVTLLREALLHPSYRGLDLLFIDMDTWQKHRRDSSRTQDTAPTQSGHSSGAEVLGFLYVIIDEGHIFAVVDPSKASR
jgi:hypothetical protein